jgi:RNA polymerase-interacting CarD/CdnL/TRCF family regulator
VSELSPQEKAVQTRRRNQELKRRQQAMQGLLRLCEVFDVHASYVDLHRNEVMEAASPEQIEAWDRALAGLAERVAYVRAWLSEHRA